MKKLLVLSAMFVSVINVFAAMPRLAVMSLENKSNWSGQIRIGDGMADMLTTALMESKKFKVIERSEINKIMAEQNLGQSRAVTPETAVKIGKLLGVEYMVVGSVNQFGTEESDIGAFGVGMKSHKADVGLDIRIIDTTSGEILAAATGQSTKTSRGVKIANADILPTNVKFGSDKFNTTLIGKASRAAVDDSVKKILQDMTVSWKGVIMKIQEDGSVMINGGTTSGVATGDIYKVIRKGEALMDPETGEVLGSDDKNIGEIEVTEVKDKYSVAKIVAGQGFAVKDSVIKK